MTRLGWWENTVTTHTDLRAAVLSALNRTIDVDEDCGIAPALSLVRVTGGVGKDLAATTASLAGIPLRTTPRGWELTLHPSLESRRTAGYLREVWDVSEELLPGRVERLMVHVLGPWSMGAQIEYRGHAVMSDRPAFKDMALTLGEALREYVRRVAAAIGAEVTVTMHEPHLDAVMEGLPGATQFDPLDPVDPEIIMGVWRRFAQQVNTPLVLTCDGALPPALLGKEPTSSMDSGLYASGWHKVELPLAQLGESTPVTDAIGALVGGALGAGETTTGGGSGAGEPEITRGIGVALPASALTARTALEIEQAANAMAKILMRYWSQWTFPADLLPHCVDITVPEGVRSAENASCAAAVARTAASMLWNN
ncbi:hypothetical protein [Corynebacterium anserum]|uniref:Uncharacterized protein n=1 Tax=Corynebacterium anserum TaxID=2684406 RepID=A0A7G7YP44_9CORY|nr:hypothetical protein [Corynebacterium anserum]QNH96264.1 hypothetical protein GP473_05955 [Corynebacterium anserum]